MTPIPENKFAKEQLFANLKNDGITLSADLLNKAKNGDGKVLYDIGREYSIKKKDCFKALAWYQLSANENFSLAQNEIGNMYYNGFGSTDFLLAMEWCLKAAKQQHRNAYHSIAEMFENGYGVPVNKQKALEWYFRWDDWSYEFKTLQRQGHQLSKDEKNKSIDTLIQETEDILNKEKNKRENKSSLELEMTTEQELRLKNDKICLLQNEIQSLKNTIEMFKQQLKNEGNNIDVLNQQNHAQQAIPKITETHINNNNNSLNSERNHVNGDQLSNQTINTSIKNVDGGNMISDINGNNVGSENGDVYKSHDNCNGLSTNLLESKRENKKRKVSTQDE